MYHTPTKKVWYKLDFMEFRPWGKTRYIEDVLPTAHALGNSVIRDPHVPASPPHPESLAETETLEPLDQLFHYASDPES